MIVVEQKRNGDEESGSGKIESNSINSIDKSFKNSYNFKSTLTAAQLVKRLNFVEKRLD